MIRILWDDEPDGNTQHVAEHGLTPEDWEYVFENYYAESISRSSGNPIRFGYLGNRRVMIAFYWIDEVTVRPVTGYEV
jgi:hypothetical protein